MPENRAMSITELVRDYYADLHRYALRLCRSPSDAEDLTQQTFLQAVRCLDQLREVQAARGWLMTILRRLWMNAAQRRQEVASSALDLPLDQFVVAPAPNEVDEEGVRQAVNELPDGLRLPLLMFYFEELSYREIAQELNIPLGTVMSRLSRAKQRVRFSLLNHEEALTVPAERRCADHHLLEGARHDGSR